VTIEAWPNPDVMTRAAVRPARVYRVAGLAVLLIAASALPFFISDYRTFQFTLTICYAITLLGLNILTGYNGQISLGHGAFFAIGAYTAAIMMDRWDLPYWSTIPAAGLVCLGAGFLFGLPALRLEGLYLALATFALAVATPQILKYKGIEHWTGGVQGIVIGWAILKKPGRRRSFRIPSTRPGPTAARASGCPATI
jgi:branched-chain amino acid transport system permease protein